MNALLLLPSGLALTLLTLSAVCVAQTTVYRHVDENGVVTFSDTPPDASVEAEEMRIQAQTAQDPNAYLQNLDAMRESTDRMVADRQERERHRSELRQINAESSQQSPQTYSEPYPDYVNVWPVYSAPVYGRPGRPGKPPWRPGYRPKPEHPIARPPYPVQPTVPVAGGNSQLMRPINGGNRR